MDEWMDRDRDTEIQMETQRKRQAETERCPGQTVGTVPLNLEQASRRLALSNSPTDTEVKSKSPSAPTSYVPQEKLSFFLMLYCAQRSSSASVPWHSTWGAPPCQWLRWSLLSSSSSTYVTCTSRGSLSTSPEMFSSCCESSCCEPLSDHVHCCPC